MNEVKTYGKYPLTFNRGLGEKLFLSVNLFGKPIWHLRLPLKSGPVLRSLSYRKGSLLVEYSPSWGLACGLHKFEANGDIATSYAYFRIGTGKPREFELEIWGVYLAFHFAIFARP